MCEKPVNTETQYDRHGCIYIRPLIWWWTFCFGL